METNAYATPKSDVETGLEQVKIYSPTQVACGALLGGPAGLIYFLLTNFTTLGNHSARKNTIYAGITLIIALLVILPMLPDNFPDIPFTIAYIVTGRIVAEKYQITKSAIEQSEQYQFESSWKVFGLGLLCLVASAIVIMGPLFILDLLGVIAL